MHGTLFDDKGRGFFGDAPAKAPQGIQPLQSRDSLVPGWCLDPRPGADLRHSQPSSWFVQFCAPKSPKISFRGLGIARLHYSMPDNSVAGFSSFAHAGCRLNAERVLWLDITSLSVAQPPFQSFLYREHYLRCSLFFKTTCGQSAFDPVLQWQVHRHNYCRAAT